MGRTKVTFQPLRSHLRVEAKAPYWGGVTEEQVQTHMIAGTNKPLNNLSRIPKRPYAYTQNTLRVYAK